MSAADEARGALENINTHPWPPLLTGWDYQADSEFVYAAPDHIRSLLAENEQLQARLADARVTELLFRQYVTEALNIDVDSGGDEAANKIGELTIASRDQRDEARAALAQCDSVIRVALDIIDSLVDTDDCWYDHNGACQAHYIETDCSVAKAKAFLADLSDGGAQQ